MEIIKLTTRPRTGTGKSYTRKARVQGWIPAVIYGRKRQADNIEVNHREFAALVRNRKLTHIIDLQLGGTEMESMAVIREVQRHVIQDSKFFHIDFQHVDMNEKVTVEIPVELTGLPVGVKDSGGVLGNPIKRVKVECMPMEIPERITIDVSALDIGDSIHVRDVTLVNMVIKESADEVLAVVTHPTREIVEEVKPEGEAAAAEGAAGAPGAAGAAGAAAPAPSAGGEKKPEKKPGK